MGSGNSGLTDGYTQLKVSNYADPLDMDGIHYFSEVSLYQTVFNINGRETYFGTTSSVCSISHIGNLTLKDGTSLYIASLLDDVTALNSMTGGSYTTTSSPFNKIVFTSGSTLYIRSMEGNNVTSYGLVKGYTIISVADNAPYGGYILGSKDSPGGFVIMRSGSYSIADKSDFESIVGGERKYVCCWFISGVETRNLTLNLPYSSGQDINTIVNGAVDITKLQGTSQLRYVGGSFVPSSEKYDFYRSGQYTNPNEYTGGVPYYYSLIFGFQNGDDDSQQGRLSGKDQHDGDRAARGKGCAEGGSSVPEHPEGRGKAQRQPYKTAGGGDQKRRKGTGPGGFPAFPAGGAAEAAGRRSCGGGHGAVHRRPFFLSYAELSVKASVSKAARL